MPVFKTRKVDRPAGTKASKAPWGDRVHRIVGRDVGVRVDQQGRVRDTVDYGMPPDFTYTDAKACEWGKQKVKAGRKSKVDRGQCWVQLAFQDGRPHLRVCRANNEKGALIPVKSPTEARTLGRKLCEDFEAVKGDWKKFEKSLPKGYKLGAAPKPGTYCVVGARGKPLRCFKKKADADAYRKRRCGKRSKCNLRVAKGGRR